MSDMSGCRTREGMFEDKFDRMLIIEVVSVSRLSLLSSKFR